MSEGQALKVDRSTDKSSLADKATEILRRAILDLRLEPNARLDERYLQETLQMSRTPAREAMNRLLAEGFLEFRQGFGVYVRPLGLNEINEFFEGYYAEEKMLAFFCKFGDESLVRDLVDLNAKHSIAQERLDVPAIQATNREFHVRLAQACENYHILKFSQQMHDHAQRLTSFVYKLEKYLQSEVRSEQTRITGFHDRIIDCVQRQSREDLTTVMTEHAKQFHDRVSRILNHNRGALFSL